MNSGNLQRLQQQMMQELGRIQEELKTATVDGSAGGGVVKATAEAAPMPSVIVPDVTLNVPLLNSSVKAPAVPFSRSPLKVATPLVIVAVALISEPPLPEAIVAVIVPEALVTVLPPPSTTFTTGCVERSTPLVAEAGGAVWKATAAGAPTPSAIVAEMIERVPSLNWSV